MIHYRLAEEADLGQIAEMRWDYRMEVAGDAPLVAQAKFIEQCGEFLRAGLETGNWTCWVAVYDARVVGVMAVQVIDRIPKPALLNDRWGYLTNCYTRPEFRGRGIGGALLSKVKSWAQDQGLELLMTWPAEGRQAFYGRHGFSSSKMAMELSLRSHVG